MGLLSAGTMPAVEATLRTVSMTTRRTAYEIVVHPTRHLHRIHIEHAIGIT
tara:strand:- start:1545 stop:1697 length:153 start_codon:yes stop_codon:yes gene_type:complete